MVDFYRRLYRLILSARYKVKLVNEDLLKTEAPKIILPNHVSHLDAQLMSIVVYEYTDFVPLVHERFFKIPIIRYFLKHLKAVSVPDFKKGSRDISFKETFQKRIQKAFTNNKSVVIYPAGQLSKGGIEKIFNKQTAYTTVKNKPENVNVIGVRIKGLYGSIWSTAWKNKTPVVLKVFPIAILFYFVNLIFFCPKRRVNIEFVDITKEAEEHAKGKRRDFNQFLEDFYNKKGKEAPTFVRHIFYLPKFKRRITSKL